jgi:hypothetical protein
MITVIMGGEGLIRVDILDPNETFIQDHFMSFVLSDLKNHEHNSGRRKHPIELAVHMTTRAATTDRESVTK